MTYRPPFLTETNEATWNDCTWRSVTMGLGKWSKGVLYGWRDGKVPALIQLSEQLRLASGDTEGGSSLDDVARGLRKTWPGLPLRNYDTPGWAMSSKSEMVARLEDGVGFAIGGYEMDFPPYLRRWTNNDDFWHMVYIQDLQTIDASHKHGVANCEPGTRHVYLMDPLGRGGYDGEWVPFADVFPFIWLKDGEYLYVMSFPEGEVSSAEPPYLKEAEPMLVPGEAKPSSTKALPVAAGTDVYRRPEGAVLKTIRKDRNLPYFGRVSGEPGWVAVLVNDEDKDYIGYVVRGDTPLVDIPPVNPPVDPAEVEALKAALAASQKQNAALARKVEVARTKGTNLIAFAERLAAL